MESGVGYSIVVVHVLPFHQRWCVLHLLKQLFGLDCVFYSTPTRTCWYSPSHKRSVFAQLPPYWTMTALSLPVVLKNWQQAQMSAPGNVFVMLQFFFFCFRTAWMFLLHMFSSSCHQESSVCLFYIYFGRSHELCYHTWPFIKTLSSAASKTIWPNWN